MRSIVFASLRVGLACFACVSLSACGAGNAAEPPAATADAPAAKDAPSSEARLRERLLGQWRVTLPEQEARLMVVARAALATPPDETALARIHPTPDEQDKFRSVVRLRRSDPASPALAAVREKIASYEAMQVVFTASKVAFRTADESHEQAYRIVEARADGGAIQVEEERIDVSFTDADHVVLQGHRRMAFTRQGASDVPVASRGTGDASVASAPDSRAEGAADACTAYADCIDRMPRLSGDQPTMAGSSRLIRSWERTPERLEQCASALKLARGAGLCP